MTIYQSASPTRLSSGIGRQWMLANTVAYSAALPIFALIAEGFGGPEDTMRSNISHVIGLLVAGVIVGVAQWLILRSHFRRTGWVVLANSAGWLLGFLGGFLVVGPPFDFTLGFLVSGLLSSVMLWPVLKRQGMSGGWWVAANAGGWIVAGAVVLAVVFALADGLDGAVGSGLVGFLAVVTMIGAVGGLVGGSITGIALQWIVRQSTWWAGELA